MNEQALADALDGRLFTVADPGYESEVATANTAVVHRPDIVVGAASSGDVVKAVKYAAAQQLSVTILGGGHGAHTPVDGGLMITTKRLTDLRIDGRVATAGAGLIWKPLVAAAAEEGLAPIAGSSTQVGIVGYLLGGGLGPLVRSHGISSDHILEMTVVSGTGEILRTSAQENADLFWALRGGKSGLGVVTEVHLRLYELPTIYAGALTFTADNIEAVLRGWIEWTASADPQVSTSISVVNFPDLEQLPPSLRGKRLLNLRFAFPGDATRGAELAAPLRALAPAENDSICDLPIGEIASIHNDPVDPGPAWVSGGLLRNADQQFATEFLRQFGVGSKSPFLAAEIRHLGSAVTIDVPEGSAYGGRRDAFVFGLVGTPNPALFPEVLPLALRGVTAELAPWISSETTINFAGRPRSAEHYASAWPLEVFERLRSIREKYDPAGVFAPYL